MERRTGTGRRRGLESWRSLVRRFPGSGLTLAAYCAREGISAASFYRWRALLGGAADGKVVTRRPAVAAGTPDFVELGTLPPASSQLTLRLDLGGGLILQIARG